MLPFESSPSPVALTVIVPPFIVRELLLYVSWWLGRLLADESAPPAALIPSSLATRLIVPALITIVSASSPSYDLVTSIVIRPLEMAPVRL